ncbi:MAG TPA: CBS domain-containing protein [Pyrinomonadaceae bacterium]|jgi:CBS domain-containing protein
MMSRDRYDRDDEAGYYGGGSGRRGRAGSSSDWRGEEGAGSERTGYGYGGGGWRGGDYGDYGSRGEDRQGGGSRAYGYGRDYGRDYRRDYGRGSYDESRYRGGGYDESRERDDYGRGSYDEGRGYARGSYGERGRRVEGRSRVRCRDIMTKDVVVATRDTTVQQVAAMMRDEDTGVIPVVERTDAGSAPTEAGAEQERERGNGRTSHGKLVGLITDRDIVVRAIAEGKDATLTRAEEVMTTDIHSAQPNDRVVDAIRKMGDKQVRRIPVVDGGGNLRGIISMADVALETEEDRELADALEEISSGASFWSKIFG